jgi:uncharacterized membrane protein
MLGTIVAIFTLAEFVRWYFNFDPNLQLSSFSWSGMIEYLSSPDIKHWVYTGWFPILPWMGIMLYGAFIGRLFVASHNENFFESKIFRLNMIIILPLSLALFAILPSPNFYVRYGYAEIFYPAHSGVLILLLLCPMSILAISNWIQKNKIMNTVFGELGRSSLVLYVFHLFLIECVSENIIGSITSLSNYYLLFALHFLIVYGLAHLLLQFKIKHEKMPIVIAWLIGK